MILMHPATPHGHGLVTTAAVALERSMCPSDLLGTEGHENAEVTG